MNYSSLEEAFGTDPYNSFINTKTTNSLSNSREINLEDINNNSPFNINNIESYNSHNGYDNSVSFCNNKNTVEEPIQPKPVNIPIKPTIRPVPCQQKVYTNTNTKLQQRELTNAIIYIVSGIYVIFILDLFVKMGSKL